MKTAYRIYVLLCVVAGIYFQHGNAHPDYFLGGFYGLIGSWIGPGMLLEFLLGHSHNMLEVLGGSFVFWIVVGLIHKAGRKKAHGRRGSKGIAVGASNYDVLPNLPPGFGYYTKPQQRTSRTTYYLDEEE